MHRPLLVSFVVCALALAAGAQRTSKGPWQGRQELRRAPRPNILMIVVDDLGWRDIDASVPTPNIDLLADQGMSFRRLYTSSICSASRYALLFGKYPFREQIGWWINPYLNGEVSVPLERKALPEALKDLGYRTLHTGKWHLSTLEHMSSLGIDPNEAPRQFGFDNFRAGRLGNLAGMNTFFNWVRVDDGVQTTSTIYNTTAIRHETVEWWKTTPGPKFAYVAFHAAHVPYHVPPAHLLPPGYTIGPGNRGLFEAMIVALDTEIGNLLSAVDLTSTLVILVSDNGTPIDAIAPDQTWYRVKASAYEGGINVPAIVSGWRVRQNTESNALIGMTDVYATILDLLEAPVPAGHAQDSVSFKDCLADPNLPGRGWAYAQVFTPNGAGAPIQNSKAVVTDTYKLWFTDGNEALFDLAADPAEDNPLPSSSDPLLYGVLRGHMNALEAQGAP